MDARGQATVRHKHPETLDGAAPRHLAGLLLLPSLATRPELREQVRDQPELFDLTAEFCVKYDAPAVKKDYDTLPVSFL